MLRPTRSYRAIDESLAVAAPQAPQSEDSALPRLLVIDDDYLHRKIICRVGAKAGYAPAGAATYEEAARLALETPFDCISLDLSLGRHAGLDMLQYLRDDGKAGRSRNAAPRLGAAAQPTDRSGCGLAPRTFARHKAPADRRALAGAAPRLAQIAA